MGEKDFPSDAYVSPWKISPIIFWSNHSIQEKGT